MNNTSSPHRFKTISEFHQSKGLSAPEHPLISIINLYDIKQLPPDSPHRLVTDFYFIAIKKDFKAKVLYGQQEYDFDEGVLMFLSPGQVYSIEMDEDDVRNYTGWMLLVHPDFLWNTPLAKTITQYKYFGYAVHEALHLSQKEEETTSRIIQEIKAEYHTNIDKFSKDIIIAQLEVLLNYAQRFYSRQFITREITNRKLLSQLENVLSNYFNDDLFEKGLPTVQQVAEQLNVSPNYLSTLLKKMTGQSTQNHIHEKLVEKAKGKLSTTDLSVSEIAYDLGFEHPQSFSRLFKKKTDHSPLEFRNSFN